MSGLGTGYDLSCTTFSPDGRIFQIEYAGKAVENSGTAVGIKVKDGVVMGVEKLIISKMLEPGTNKRIHTLDKHVGLCFSGLSADARQLVNRGRLEAKNYKSFYLDPIPSRLMNERIAGFMQAHTLYSHIRPFGCAVLLASYDHTGPQLHMIEPSGNAYAYFGAAAGKARQAAKGEIEKLKLTEMTAREAVKEVARIVHDEVKDKDFELEMSWICEESKFEHQMVPKDLLDEAEKAAKASLEEEMSDDD